MGREYKECRSVKETYQVDQFGNYRIYSSEVVFATSIECWHRNGMNMRDSTQEDCIGLVWTIQGECNKGTIFQSVDRKQGNYK